MASSCSRLQAPSSSSSGSYTPSRMESQRGEAGPTNQSPEADTKIREVCCRRLPNGYVELILIGAIDASERARRSRLSFNLRKRALPLLPGTAQRYWLEIASSFPPPHLITVNARPLARTIRRINDSFDAVVV